MAVFHHPHMTLRARLTAGLLTIAIILILPLLVATRSLDHLRDQARALRDGDFAASLVLGKLRDALNDVRSAEMAVLFVPEEKSRETMMARIRDVEALADSMERYQLGRSARDIRVAMTSVAEGTNAEFQATTAGRARDAERTSQSTVVPALARAERAVAIAERQLRDRTRVRVAESANAAERSQRIAVISLAVALLAATLIAIRLAYAVSHPVRELERGMREVSDGDFGARLDISPARGDEFGKLAASFAAMTRQLAELDKLKAEFVSVASHELKTPINVVLGYTQLLQQEIYGPLTDKQRNVTAVLEKQIKQLSHLVQQLLDVTRFEAGGGKLEPRPVELRGFLHNLEDAFHVLADQRGIRFQIGIDESLPQTVYWDADRMNEVLGNLLSNAFKFTERGGEVDLLVNPVDHSVQIDVKDTGAGIPPEQLHRIFDKFYQADNQGAASHAGSGLGLAIVRQIVEAHNGTVACDSTPGVGTTFSIVLPERVNGRRNSARQPRIPAEVG
jgi:signal transduction histidine kinase